MFIYVALLRGINVGGKNILPMQKFRELLADLGCEDVSTYIQSGNAVCRYSGSAPDLSAEISNSIDNEFNFRPAVMVMTAAEFVAVAAANPFAHEIIEPKTLHICFMQEPATDADTAHIAELAAADETFHLTDTAFYLHAPSGIGRSRLAAAVERCLGVETTGRNWRTVSKIRELISDLA